MACHPRCRHSRPHRPSRVAPGVSASIGRTSRVASKSSARRSASSPAPTRALEQEDEFGDILFVVTNIADSLGIDAEQALRGANGKFRRRFGHLERLAGERGLDLRELDITALDALWDEAKALERAQQ
jgi:nucleoside triphosphate diphosphatase